MAIKLKNAILHSLSSVNGASVLSDTELDIDSEACFDFINQHVKKLMGNTASKEATFKASSEVYKHILDIRDNKKSFQEAGVQIGKRLSDIMAKCPNIPAGDLLIALFEVKHDKHLAIIKLNYKEIFTHQHTRKASGNDNQLVKVAAALPFDSGKTEEACIVSLADTTVKVIEKPFEIDGEMIDYFSEMFLVCETAISKKEAAEIIKGISEEINEEFLGGSVDGLAKIKTALIACSEESEGEVSLEDVASKAFGSNTQARDAYMSMARDSGLSEDLLLGDKFVRQQFGIQKIKTDNGVELKFPAELWGKGGSVEFIKTKDGSPAILLTNLGEITMS
jgi:hypothetical protein